MVDCQPLARTLNGTPPWKNKWGTEVFHTTCNALRKWVVKRGLPDLLAQPVVWRERGFNKMADYLANQAMDTRSSWKWHAPDADRLITRAKGLIGFSDGGYRPGPNLASAGWVVVVICEDDPQDVNVFSSSNNSINSLNDPFSNICDHRAEKLAEGACFLPTCKSSFEAELVAVSELMSHVDSLALSGTLPPFTSDRFAGRD